MKNPGIKSRLDTSDLKRIIAKDFEPMELIRINLDSLELPFDKKAQKWIFMKLDENSVSLNKGFTKDKRVFFDPDSVLITGPKSIVSTIKDTLNVKIPFVGLDKNFDESFNLNYYLNNSFLHFSHQKVNVKFNVRKRQTSN